MAHAPLENFLELYIIDFSSTVITYSKTPKALHFLAFSRNISGIYRVTMSTTPSCFVTSWHSRFISGWNLAGSFVFFPCSSIIIPEFLIAVFSIFANLCSGNFQIVITIKILSASLEKDPATIPHIPLWNNIPLCNHKCVLVISFLTMFVEVSLSLYRHYHPESRMDGSLI
ncbi:hypothetical protein ACJX0J_024127 [Zea mays]